MLYSLGSVRTKQNCYSGIDDIAMLKVGDFSNIGVSAGSCICQKYEFD